MPTDIGKYRQRKPVTVEEPIEKTEDHPGDDGFVVHYDGGALSLKEFRAILAEFRGVAKLAQAIQDASNEAEAGALAPGTAKVLLDVDAEPTDMTLDFLEKVGMSWNLTENGKPIPTDRKTLEELKPARVVMMASNAILSDMQGSPKGTKISETG